MRKSPLAELLKVLSPEERAEFSLFVASPYFNRGEFSAEAPRLLRFLYETALESYWQDEARRAAYDAVFPGADFVEGKLEKVMSVLHRLARLFVSEHLRSGEKGEFQHLFDLAAFSRQRGLHNRFDNTMQRLRERFGTRSGGEDIAFFFRSLQIELEQHEYENLFNRKRGDIHIPQTLEALDLHYYTLKMNLLNRFLMQQKVTHLEIDEEMRMALTETEIPVSLLEKSAFLQMAQSFLRVLHSSKPEKSDFHALARILRDLEGKIQTELLKDYYSFLRSCCSVLVNTGELDYLPVLFQLQKDHLERGYLYYNQKISPSMFQNVVNVALRVKEFDWVYACIQAHADRVLGDNEHRDYYRLNLANYLFHIGDYEAALDALPQSLADIQFQIMSRRLELKIYYSLNSDLLSYKMEAFRLYLIRSFLKPLSRVLKESNGNFVNLLMQLCNIAKGDKTRIQRLKERVRSKTWVFERDWLLEKAEELL